MEISVKIRCPQVNSTEPSATQVSRASTDLAKTFGALGVLVRDRCHGARSGAAGNQEDSCRPQSGWESPSVPASVKMVPYPTKSSDRCLWRASSIPLSFLEVPREGVFNPLSTPGFGTKKSEASAPLRLCYCKPLNIEKRFIRLSA